MRGCLLGCVTLIAVSMVALAVWFGTVGLFHDGSGAAPPLLAQRATATTPPRSAQATPRATAVLPTSRAPANQPVPSGGVEVELVRLTEADVTQALRQGLAASPEGAAFEDPAARLSPGRVTVTGTFRGMVVPIAVTVSGKPEVRDRRPRFTVETVEGAGMPLPDGVRDTINRLLQADDLIPAPTGVEITRIDVMDGELAIYGLRHQHG